MPEYHDEIRRAHPEPDDYTQLTYNPFESMSLFCRLMQGPGAMTTVIRLIVDDTEGDLIFTSEPLSHHEADELLRLLQRGHFTTYYNNEAPFESLIAKGQSQYIRE